MGERVRVYMFEGSNSCLTGLLMLEHKGVEYERIDLPPAAHAVLVRRRGFPKRTVPAMLIDLHFADLRPLLEGRSSVEWARRVVPEYGGPVGPVLPPEWLAELGA